MNQTYATNNRTYVQFRRSLFARITRAAPAAPPNDAARMDGIVMQSTDSVSTFNEMFIQAFNNSEGSGEMRQLRKCQGKWVTQQVLEKHNTEHITVALLTCSNVLIMLSMCFSFLQFVFSLSTNFSISTNLFKWLNIVFMCLCDFYMFIYIVLQFYLFVKYFHTDF